MAADPEVIIVGAGLAGLCCARSLALAGVPFVLIEAADAPGGRVRTDAVDGFLLDRGFQVLLTAYPECRRVLDYPALDLRPFYPGALVRYDGRLHRLADPWRRPLAALGSLFDSVGTLADKWRIAVLRADVRRGSVEDLFRRPETTTEDDLRRRGFGPSIVDRFFRPFFGGVFLDRRLATSSRFFEFVFRMFAEGDISLPARGMGAIPAQLAQRLPPGSLQLNTRVAERIPGGVRLSDGRSLLAPRVVLAVEGPEAVRLVPELPPVRSRAVACVYFAANQPPVREPILVLDGDGKGPVNNFCVPSLVAPGYAPPGQALLSASVLDFEGRDDAVLESAVRAQLTDWFGPEVRNWRHLRTYRILHAQPDQAPPALAEPQRPVRLRPDLVVCGDHRDTASLHGAMLSGRRAAEAILAERGASRTP